MAVDPVFDTSYALVRVLSSARDEARHLDQAPIDTGHLLIGLVSDSISDAGQVLHHAGVSPGAVRLAVASRGPRHAGDPDRLSSSAVRVLRYARREATSLGHSQIGTLHLLLGILWHESCLAARILDELTVTTALDHLIVERLRTGGELPSTVVGV